MNPELARTIGILERREGVCSRPNHRTAGVYFDAANGHRIVLEPERAPLLGYAVSADLQVIDFGTYTFAVAIRLELDGGAQSKWHWWPYAAHRDPGRPQAICDLYEQSVPPHALNMEIVTFDESGDLAVLRRTKLPFGWLCRLNSRVQRSLSAQMRPQSIAQAVDRLNTMVDDARLDTMRGDCVTIPLTA
jgi:hypothetical protein